MTNVLLDDLFNWAEAESKIPGHIPSLGVHLTKYIVQPGPVTPELEREIAEATSVGTLSFRPARVSPPDAKAPASFAGVMTYKQLAGGTEVLTVQISPPALAEPHPPVLTPPPQDSYTVTFVPERGQPPLLPSGTYALVCSPVGAISSLSGVVTATDGVMMHLQAELLPTPAH
jgi:hypothetical protein